MIHVDETIKKFYEQVSANDTTNGEYLRVLEDLLLTDEFQSFINECKEAKKPISHYDLIKFFEAEHPKEYFSIIEKLFKKRYFKDYSTREWFILDNYLRSFVYYLHNYVITPDGYPARNKLPSVILDELIHDIGDGIAKHELSAEAYYKIRDIIYEEMYKAKDKKKEVQFFIIEGKVESTKEHIIDYVNKEWKNFSFSKNKATKKEPKKSEFLSHVLQFNTGLELKKPTRGTSNKHIGYLDSRICAELISKGFKLKPDAVKINRQRLRERARRINM